MKRIKRRQATAATVAVLGGGPAGLSAAKCLHDKGLRPTVFEAADRLGGKSLTIFRDGCAVEMGTCYTTLNHGLVKRWMRECGISLRPLGRVEFDDAPIIDYVKSGGGAPLAVQVLRYLLASKRLKIALQKGDAKAPQEGAMSTGAWLDGLNLPKIRKAFHRLQTAQGYGYLDDTTIAQTLTWCDLGFILSGVKNRLEMPVEGWSPFWERLGAELDCRLGHKVTGVSRFPGGIEVETRRGRERFDYLVNTLPPDIFCQLTDPTCHEQQMTDAIEWQTYVTTAFTTTNWFKDKSVVGWPDALTRPEHAGGLIGARRDTVAPSGPQVYVTGQFAPNLTAEEARRRFEAEARARSIPVAEIVDQKVWRYFPRLRADAIREGILTTRRQMQGERRTWHGGAAFSHELVSSVSRQAAELARSISRQRCDSIYAN